MATASSSKVLISFDVDGTLIHTVGKDANKVAEFGWLKMRCSNFHNALLHKDGRCCMCWCALLFVCLTAEI